MGRAYWTRQLALVMTVYLVEMNKCVTGEMTKALGSGNSGNRGNWTEIAFDWREVRVLYGNENTFSMLGADF